jgi:hypothetical protein
MENDISNGTQRRRHMKIEKRKICEKKKKRQGRKEIERENDVPRDKIASFLNVALTGLRVTNV